MSKDTSPDPSHKDHMHDNNPTQATQTDNSRASIDQTQTPTTTTTAKHKLYWFDKTGKYHCENCSKSGDKFYMEDSNCGGFKK